MDNHSTINFSLEELKKAQRQAIDAEINIKALLDANTQSILLLETDGSVIHVNSTVGEILKTSPDKLRGKNIFQCLPQELGNQRQEHFDKVVATGVPEKFTDIRDGRVILHSHYPISNNGEVKRVAIYAEDITDIIQKEQELEQSRHTQAVLFEIMRLSSSSETLDDFLKSVHETVLSKLNTKHLVIALLDQKEEKLSFSYSLDKDAVSYPPIDNIHDPSTKRISLLPIRTKAIVRMTRQEILESARMGALDIIGPVPEIWVGIPMFRKNEIIGVLIVQDHNNQDAFDDDAIKLLKACSNQIAQAIERKNFDTAIKESEELYRAFFEDNHSVMFIIDPIDGKILDTNSAAEKFYGYPRNEIKSKTIFDINRLSKKETLASMARARAADLSSFIFQHRLANGEIRDVEVFSGPFQFREKTSLISIVHDITERLKNEMELSKAKETAVIANKTKDEFLANISHEIRTPLNGVMGMLQLLDSADLDPQNRNYVNVALQSSRNLLRVLDDILDLSKAEMGTLDLIEEKFSLKKLLDQCVALFSFQAEEKNINFAHSIHTGLAESFIGDEGRIRQILFNLLGNAIKFTEQGTVTVEVREGNQSAEGRQEIHFTISDTGVGIPENYLESIFDSFTQVDGSLSRRYKGAGLGLSIVKRLVELMNGSINIKSALGKGTSVSVVIELKVAETTAATSKIIPGSNCPLLRLKIMLVEDELVNRMMARKILERMGHEVICAQNGAKCLKLLHESNVDIILMDIQMPVMDGLEATRTIRTSDKFNKVREIPIIALSAHANKESRYSALEAGVNGYLCKPFEMHDLENIISKTVYAKYARS